MKTTSRHKITYIGTSLRLNIILLNFSNFFRPCINYFENIPIFFFIFFIIEYFVLLFYLLKNFFNEALSIITNKFWQVLSCMNKNQQIQVWKHFQGHILETEFCFFFSKLNMHTILFFNIDIFQVKKFVCSYTICFQIPGTPCKSTRWFF